MPQRRRLYLWLITLVMLTGTVVAVQIYPAQAQPAAITGSVNSAQAAVPLQTSTPPTDCGLAWRVVTSPNTAQAVNTLNATVALRDNDMWAVGSAGNFNALAPLQTLIEHGDGSSWSRVPSPNGSGTSNALHGVAAVAANDLWAVGESGQQTLVEHWDGSSWSVIPSPSMAQVYNTLRGVTALAADNVWAVGYYTLNGYTRTLILHWDGSAWSIMPSPNVGSFGSDLQAVAGWTANDVWAVGGRGFRHGTLIEHWDGTTWSVVESPTGPIGDYFLNSFYGVNVRAADDIWAVGDARNNSASKTLIEHWDGTAWTIVDSPNGNLNSDNKLLAVASAGASDIWAVGYYNDAGSSDPRPLIAHWNGSAWAQVAAPYPGPYDDRLFGVAALSVGNVWAVGQQAPQQNAVVTTLVEHWSDPCLTPLPTATGATSTPSPTATPACVVGWSVVPSANEGSGSNHLAAVAAISANDQWSVGSFQDVNGIEQALIEHWNGLTWETVPSPAIPAATGTRLKGVAVVAGNNVWAVGDYTLGSEQRTLILHWDGSSWTAVSSPNPGSYNFLNAITAVTANDLWAVGYYETNGIERTMQLHWNGSAWIVVPAEVPLGGYTLFNLLAVDAFATNDVWAVGFLDDGGYPNTLTLHWNGTQWNVVASPSPGMQYEDALTGVSVITATDVWAVGYSSLNGVRQTLTLHWDGSAWTVGPSHNTDSGDNSLSAVAALATNDVWAVGSYRDSSAGITDTLALHWNGSTWGIATSPNPAALSNTLNGVVAFSGGDVWAVGDQTVADGRTTTLVEHYSGLCQTATATVTGTPPTPTATRTPTVTRTATLTVTPSPTCTPVWSLSDTAPAGTLWGVSAPTTNDVWAVGNQINNTLIKHWNGTAWAVVPSPNLGTDPNVLYAVAMPAAGDGWAVGTAGTNMAGSNRTLIEHWDGSSWSLVASPNPVNSGNYLYGVTASAPDNAWAVGERVSNTGRLTLILHWDGTIWQEVASPNKVGFNVLQSVVARTATDVWAVGNAFDNSNTLYTTLIEHWDGATWSIVSSPNAGNGTDYLTDVSVSGLNDVWAVGAYQAVNTAADHPLTLHWNGTQWSIATTPDITNQHLALRGVIALSSSNVWAVGYADATSLILHWEGGSWQRVNSPNSGSSENNLLDVAGTTATDLWSVGQTASSSFNQTLIEHYQLACGTPTATQTATGTPAATTVTRTPLPSATLPATSTATVATLTRTPLPSATLPATGTAAVATVTRTPLPSATLPATGTATVTTTATATACPLQFSDVPPGSTFYSNIRCLTCQAIVGGYTDAGHCPNGAPCFQPGANVTRGQMSKFIAGSAGYTDVIPADRQTFGDVPPGSTFWLFIERAYAHGVIGGYTDAGHCPNDVPCFQPGAAVTRGQTAKFVAGARGYSDPIPASRQTFNDVPPTDVFWGFIERVYAHNIVSGYSCGNPEPCPGLYFRPTNPVTRGQTAKFISNAFFPNCPTALAR
ncbi:MAG: S-layer homology domain-containing protein [Chloroflexota bacterium]|nr:S-layer homology domain-containing protein [Chloroflexota bacterium]